MKNFAVIGNPVGHSRSPVIFNSLFDRFGMDCNYISVSTDSPYDCTGMIEKYNFSGVNVTSPFKEDVYKLIRNSDDVSKKICAVNVVLNRNGALYGMNTDVFGVMHSLIDNNIDVKSRKCVILGAGGAARAAIQAVSELGGDVFVCNRTDVKAQNIAKHFNCGFLKYRELKRNLADAFLLVLTVPEISIDIKDGIMSTIVLNANYRDDSLRNYCRRYIDGYEWLIYQAVKTFEHFFDRTIDSGMIKRDLMHYTVKKNIAIIGMTGSGKTTYGKIIADHYGVEFYDTDSEIELKRGIAVDDIFRLYGENEFRKIEEVAVNEICQKEGEAVIAVGAGALNSEKNRRILKGKCYVVMLDINTDLIISRLNGHEILKRPKLKNENIKEVLEIMFDERKQSYMSSADLILSITSDDPYIESGKIIRELDAR